MERDETIKFAGKVRLVEDWKGPARAERIEEAADGMAKILICDSYYPQFLQSWDFNPACTYQSELKRLLEFSFGTGDFYSRNLRAMGWEAQDIVWNAPLQNDVDMPDVLFLQDLSIELPFDWKSKVALIAGQLSCPWPGDAAVRRCDVVFTSFPHYIPRIEVLGVKAVYNPLAFDPIVLQRINDPVWRGGVEFERIHDCVFIGGVGNPSHWRRGMETLEAVARAIPTFKWWGYGFEHLPSDSALRDKYQGEAWGLDMYRIMLQSKIVLNRHGEVAEGYANNMRMFEATGCGAALLTEDATNLNSFFTDEETLFYNSPEQAVEEIRYWLNDETNRLRIAANGQARTLRTHTYAQRMKTVSDTLQEMLVSA